MQNEILSYLNVYNNMIMYHCKLSILSMPLIPPSSLLHQIMLGNYNLIWFHFKPYPLNQGVSQQIPTALFIFDEPPIK